MKRALFWTAFGPLALSLVAISLPGVVLTFIEACYRALVMVYDELLHRFEGWCFNYGRVNQSLLSVFMEEFRDNAIWKQL